MVVLHTPPIAVPQSHDLLPYHGKIKAVKINLSVLALEILRNSLPNRGKYYAFNLKRPECQRAWGYAVPPPTSQPTYSSTYTIIQQPATTTSVVVVGGCPACRVGVLEDTFTCLGVLCAIVFFPIGILFCLALRQRRCPNCGAAFG
ncbi:PREDICTED: brain protein I3 [Charadrius vociferus]|nr:PREDICTED: brain protein I3 [Charadrius vociferus]